MGGGETEMKLRRRIEMNGKKNVKEQKKYRAGGENPMQEMDCHPGNAVDVIAATRVFAGRLSRVRDETGQPSTPLFVP